MGLIKFKLKEEHLTLIKNLQWDLEDGKYIVTKQPSFRNVHNFPINSPFGGDNVYEDMLLILKGNVDREIDVMEDNFTLYTEEEKEEFDKLLSELPTALDIINFTQSFEVGNYKTKFNIRNWVKK